MAATAVLLGSGLGSAAGPLATDTTPPVIHLYPLPSITDTPSISVQGTVSDVSPCNVTVNGLWVLTSNTGVFVVRIPLVPGNNTITVRAVDAAGNEAVALAYVEFIPPPDRWFVHPEKHFRILIPYGWHGYANFTQNGVPVDVYMYTESLDANLIVVSEPRRLTGTPEEAFGILTEATSNLSRSPGFHYLKLPVERSVDGHMAASVFVTWEAPGETVDQLILIVLGPEYGMFWALIGTMTPANVTQAAPLINRTTAAFDVLPVPSFEITAWHTPILVGALAATAAEGSVFVFLVLRDRRRRMPWDRAYL